MFFLEFKQVAMMFSQQEHALTLSLSATCDSGEPDSISIMYKERLNSFELYVWFF